MSRLPLAARSLLLSSLFVAACCASARAQADATATPESAQPSQEKVYAREEVTKPAVIVSMPGPVYHNYGVKLLDQTGAVKVSVVLSSSGRVTDVRVLEGLSQNQNLAALKAARRIVFMPAQKDGVPVSQSFVASYGFTVTTNETGKREELKGLTKFYVDTGGDREALGVLTGEVQKRLPRLVIVDRPEEAECILLVNSANGRGWAFKPVSPDKRRVFLYYVGITPKSFARGFVYEYKKVNDIKD